MVRKNKINFWKKKGKIMDTLSQFPTWLIPVVLIIIGVLVLLVKTGTAEAKLRANPATLAAVTSLVFKDFVFIFI